MFQCKRPMRPTRGNFEFNNKDESCKPRSFPWKKGDKGIRYQIGCEITYACDEGYLLSDNSTKRCTSNGDWGERPKCKKGNRYRFDMMYRGIRHIIIISVYFLELFIFR